MSLSSAIAKRAGNRPDRKWLLSEAKSYADRVLAGLETIRHLASDQLKRLQRSAASPR